MTRRFAAHVLYEDSRTPLRGFGLHELVCACVADRVDAPPHEIQQLLDAIPKRGIDKLLGAVTRDLADLGQGAPVFALVDEDRIREKLNLPPDACRGLVVEAIRGRSNAPGRLEVVVLRQNMETLVAEAFECIGSLEAHVLRRAIEQKNLEDRDRILRRAAKPPERRVRECVLAKVPSLARLVERLATQYVASLA